MAKTFRFLTCSMAALAFAACNNDELVPGPDQVDGTGAKVSITLFSPDTRADEPDEPGVGVENTINSLNIYVFKSDGTFDVEKLSPAVQTNYAFVVPNPGANMKFLVSINQNTGSMASKTYDQACEMLADAAAFAPYVLSGTGGNTMAAPTPYFAMSGKATATVTAAATPSDSPVTPVAIPVHRLVSKIVAPKVVDAQSFVNNIPTADIKALFGDPNATGSTFAMTGYTFINGMDNSDAFFTWNASQTETLAWDTWNRTAKANIFSGFDGSGAYSKVYAGALLGDMFLTGDNTIYAYENQPKDDSAEPTLFFERNTVYSFIIKGTLTNVAEPTQVMTRYWRANLIQDDNHTVWRNTIYRMTIQGINTIGYGTPEDAEDEVVPKNGNASVQVTITVANWRVKSSGVIL